MDCECCGRPIEDDSVYCNQCGDRLIVTDATVRLAVMPRPALQRSRCPECDMAMIDLASLDERTKGIEQYTCHNPGCAAGNMGL